MQRLQNESDASFNGDMPGAIRNCHLHASTSLTISCVTCRENPGLSWSTALHLPGQPTLQRYSLCCTLNWAIPLSHCYLLPYCIWHLLHDAASTALADNSGDVHRPLGDCGRMHTTSRSTISWWSSL